LGEDEKVAHVVIIGGGFAGVWSAAGAALARGDADLRITLIAPNEQLVLRPRLYEPEPELATVELNRILEPIGAEHVRASVSTIDTDRRVVVADGNEIGYDRLVLAAGSRLVRPDGLPGAERLFDIDTPDGARRLTDHLRDREDHSVVVVGAGFVGLEAATELAARGRVLLVDRSAVVGDQLGAGPREVIEAALDDLGVERRLGTTVTEVGDGYAVLSDGSRVEADAVVWSVGMRASELTRQISAELDHLGRVPWTIGCVPFPRCSSPGTRPRQRSTPSTRSCRPASTPPRSARSPGTTPRPTCSTCRCATSPPVPMSPAWTWAVPVGSSPGAGTAG